MPVKRRNHGRSRHGRHKTTLVDCSHCNCKPPKDKAISRYISRNIADASSLRDLQEASVYTEYQLPKIYRKNYYCVSCAVHSRVVRGRSREDRRNRAPPPRFRRPVEKKKEDKPNTNSGGPPGVAAAAAAAAAPKPVA
mmetsp:Transcript_32728/g.98885  ORF Transcript_32728/g.98885 Transcript_32728/m.98885 type:complete len:138 (+) Transcript_32728:624-1037(+)